MKGISEKFVSRVKYVQCKKKSTILVKHSPVPLLIEKNDLGQKHDHCCDELRLL